MLSHMLCAPLVLKKWEVMSAKHDKVKHDYLSLFLTWIINPCQKKKKKKWTCEAPHLINRRGENEDNNCQSIWDKSEVIWRTCLGTDWNLESNIVRTHLEHIWEKWKGRCYWERLGGGGGTIWELGEPFGNLIGTHREDEGNKGWKKANKNSRPLPSQKGKKNLDPSWVHPEPFIGCMKLFVSKTVCHHFWRELINTPPPSLPFKELR
jgi:hypothetical protein